MSRNHSGPVVLADKFALFSAAFSPRRVAHVNDFVVKIVKVRGEFVWHAHAHTDELFLVHRGSMTVRYRDRDVVLAAGDLHVVPRGVEHMTLAEETCEALVFEPADTVNTGDAGGAMTASDEPFV
jgi:mannose-6-phosphate isomerase-like protein (cupin superfamily)